VIHAYTFPDPVQAHDAMCERLMFGDAPGVDYDWTHGTEVGLHNVAIHCDTVDFDYNLKRLWVPPSRWTMMVRQYIDPLWLDDCLDKVAERMSGRYAGRKGRGIATLRTGEHDIDDVSLAVLGEPDYDDIGIVAIKTRMVQGKGTGRGVRRRWGSCMLNMSFRANPVPTVSLHSRTTYFGYLAMVDMAVAQAFANECAQICGIPLAHIQFVWTMDLAQFHGFRSLAWCLTDDGIRSQLLEDVDRRKEFSARIKPGNQPGYRKALDGYERILRSDRAGTLYGDESFSSFARIRRRYHTEVHGLSYAEKFAGGTRHRSGKAPFPPLPDLWVSTLDFSVLGNGGPVEHLDEDDDDE
jgi:hypothetical protein